MIREAINKGVYLGLGLIFLTLIGLPSDRNVQLADLALPIYLLITFGLSWSVSAKREQVNQGMLQGMLIGFVSGAVLLSLLAIVNNWHASDINVTAEYFDTMNTFSMETLSGVPQDELFPDPSPNPITGEFADGVEQRTNPLALYFSADYGLLGILGFNIGGLIGLAALLTTAGGVGSLAQNLAKEVDWANVRQRLRHANQQLPEGLEHWLLLLLPLITFLVFWVTVEHDLSVIGLGEDVHLFDLEQTFSLTSDSLISENAIQLGLTFAIVILGIVALRNVKLEESALNFSVRVGITSALIVFIAVLSHIRIVGNDVIFITEDLFGLDEETLTLMSVWIAAAIAIGLVVSSNRQPQQYQLAFVGSVAILLILASPLFMNQSQTFTLGRVGLMVMFGLGLNITVGYAGLLDLGYVAFFGIGAYTFAFVAQTSNRNLIGLEQLNDIGWLTTTTLVIAPLVIIGGIRIWQQSNTRPTKERSESDFIQRQKPVWAQQPPWYITILLILVALIVSYGVQFILRQAGILEVGEFSSFLVALIIAILASAFVGFLLGIPVLRLRGDYLAIVTLGFGEIISLAMKNADEITGGPSGALGIPKPVAGSASVAVSNLVLLYLSVVGAVIVVALSFRLRDSRLGRAWLAMKSDEDIAQAMGINLVNTKLLAFTIGAGFAGVAGLIFASRQASIFPEDFGLEVSINALALVIIGGMGSVPGVIIGAIALVGLPEMLRPIDDYRIMAFGLLLIVTMVTRPAGLLPAPPPALEDEARALEEEEQPS